MREKKDQTLIAVRLSTSLTKQLKKFAEDRRLTQASVVEEALHTFLEKIELDTPTSRKLDELSRQCKRLNKDNEILLESFALYVRVFLTYLPELAEGDKDKAQKLGGERYTRFLGSLGQCFKSGKLFSKVLEDKIASLQDFEAQR